MVLEKHASGLQDGNRLVFPRQHASHLSLHGINESTFNLYSCRRIPQVPREASLVPTAVCLCVCVCGNDSSSFCSGNCPSVHDRSSCCIPSVSSPPFSQTFQGKVQTTRYPSSILHSVSHTRYSVKTPCVSLPGFFFFLLLYLLSCPGMSGFRRSMGGGGREGGGETAAGLYLEQKVCSRRSG